MQKTIQTVLLLLFPTLLLAQSGIIKGTVTEAISNEPIGFVTVRLEGTNLGAQTDDNGVFEITGLDPNLYTVRASFLGYEDAVFPEIQTYNNKPTTLDIKMAESQSDLAEVVVKASPFRKTEESPVSLRTIGVSEIMRNPGGNRDISLVVQQLFGVTSSPAILWANQNLKIKKVHCFHLLGMHGTSLI